jgi:hypothetical protein
VPVRLKISCVISVNIRACARQDCVLEDTPYTEFMKAYPKLMMQYFAFYCESCVFLDKSLVLRIYGKIGAESDPMERSSVNLQDNAPYIFSLLKNHKK